MRILLLTQVVPFPPDSGPKVKTYHVLRYLADQGHAVTLVSFVREGERQYLNALRSYCSEIRPVPIRRSRVADLKALVTSLRSGLPFLVTRDAKPEMFRTVRELVTNQAFDIIQADQVTMAQFALAARRDRQVTGSPSRFVFDAHNAVHKIMERSAESALALLRPFMAREGRLLKRYEGMLVRTFDHTFAVSEADKQALLAAARIPDSETRISTIPISVDTNTLRPVIRARDSLNILTMGTLFYPPNADGVRWFMRDVLPLVRSQMPDCRLTVVGPRPPRDIVQYAVRDPRHVAVTGYVPELEPYLERARVMVVPVRAGSGLRVRILEALARGVPVVTTTMGAEGIDVADSEHLLIADDPGEFAGAVVRLLRDSELGSRLAAAGRRLAESKYDWRAALPKLGEVYDSLVSAPISLNASQSQSV